MYSKLLVRLCLVVVVAAGGCGRTGLDGRPTVGAGGFAGAGHAGGAGVPPGTGGYSLAQGSSGQGGKMSNFGSGGIAGTGGASGTGGVAGTGGATTSTSTPGPVTLATDQASPVALAVDATNVYWANSGGSRRGSIMMVPIGGGPATFLSGAASAGGIALYDSNVYWASMGMGSSSGGAVSTTPRTGGSVITPTTLSTGFMNDPIAVGPTGVYGTGAVADGVTIVSSPLAGGPATPVVPASDLSQTFASYGIAVDVTSVYWTSFGDPCMVMKAPLNGGRPATLAKVTGPGFGIAVDATHVYWVTVNAVMRVALAGGSEDTLAATGGTGIAIDETSVYFTDHASPGSVNKVPLAGGPATVLASGQAVPAGIVVDATSVYWVNQGDGAGGGSVMKLTPK
jgi:hypothetical protein